MSSVSATPGVFTALEVAASGLTAERGRMNVIASNLANARTTSGADGEVYRRIDPVFESRQVNPDSFDPILQQVRSVHLARVRQDEEPGQLIYDPEHPDSDEDGYVEFPNVNVVTEMVNLMTASRAYEAGVTSIESIKSMAQAAMRIAR